MLGIPAGKLSSCRAVNAQDILKVMGDRSPKSTQKKSTQKQAKANSAAQQKQQAIAAKQTVTKKK